MSKSLSPSNGLRSGRCPTGTNRTDLRLEVEFFDSGPAKDSLQGADCVDFTVPIYRR